MYSAQRHDYPSPIASDGQNSFDQTMIPHDFNQQIDGSIGPARHRRRSPSPPSDRSPSVHLQSPYQSAYLSQRRSPPYYDNRHDSPALSMSSNSSVTAPPPQQQLPPPRQKAKHSKNRLKDSQKKEICQWHLENRNARQEDIGNRFGVERSTISKILKEKDRWLNLSVEEEKDQATKHRPSKFPEIEEKMIECLHEWTVQRMTITDSLIRTKALAIAKDYGIAPDKFKGSSGWIENFKHRHEISRGEWHNKVKYFPGNPNADPRPPRPISPPVSPDIRQATLQRMAALLPNPVSEPWRVHGQPPPAHSQGQPTIHHQPHHQTDLAAANQYYGTPAIPGGEIPPVQEADAAMNIVLSFFDTIGKTLLRGNERETLQQVKMALFQAASDLEYERPS